MEIQREAPVFASQPFTSTSQFLRLPFNHIRSGLIIHVTLLYAGRSLRGNEAVGILRSIISQHNKTRFNKVASLCYRGAVLLNNCLSMWLGVDTKSFRSEREIFLLPF